MSGDIVTTLEKRGFVKYGSGAYSIVYGHKDLDYVYKFTNDEYDEAWVDYAQLCRTKHKDNPFAPKIHWVRKTPWGFIAKMEKLDDVIDSLNVEHPQRKLYDKIQRASHSAMIRHELEQEHPTLMELIYDIENLGWVPDIHESNVMIKGDRVVIIDPVS